MNTISYRYRQQPITCSLNYGVEEGGGGRYWARRICPTVVEQGATRNVTSLSHQALSTLLLLVEEAVPIPFICIHKEVSVAEALGFTTMTTTIWVVAVEGRPFSLLVRTLM